MEKTNELEKLMEKTKEWRKLIVSDKEELEKIEEALNISERTEQLESFLKTNSNCHPVTISVGGIGPLLEISPHRSRAEKQLREDLFSVFQMYRNNIIVGIRKEHTEIYNNLLKKEG